MTEGRFGTPLQLVLISAASDFVIAAGGTVTGGSLQAKSLPEAAVWVIAVIFGLVAAGKEIKQRAIQALEIRVPEIKEPPKS